jgi:hypothetical protein
MYVCMYVCYFEYTTQNILVKSTAKKIAKISVVSADLPDFENYISLEKIEEVGSAIHVRAFMHACMYVCMCCAYMYSSRTCMYDSRKVIVMYEGSSVPYIH